MITLHESNITSFPLDNGIGVLSDAIKAYAEEEINSIFEFYMEYDSEGFLVDELKEERIIKAKAQDKLGYQLFRIYSITKNHENDNLIVNAQHITYDLANNFVEKLEANRVTKKQVMEKIGASTVNPHPFNVTSSNTTTVSSTNLYRTNPLQMIAGMEGSVLQIWGGQIERDNYHLILHDRRGHDDGVTVTYEKNITGLTAEFDISSVITRIFPFVFIEATDDEPERLITVSGKYIDSPHINDYEVIRTEPIDYSNDDRIDTQDKTDAQIRQQLTSVAKDYFKETDNDKIKSTMDVAFMHLWETEEYKDVKVLELVGMGDTVTINHSKLKVDATAIVNYIKYDCISHVNEEVKLGNVKAGLTDSINKIDSIERKVEQAESNANQAIVSANGKNTTYYGPDEPVEGMQKGDLWFKVIDGQYHKTYRFDGIEWQEILDMDSQEAKREAEQARDRADEAVNRANQATQLASNAISQAQTSFDLAQESLTLGQGLTSRMSDAEGNLTVLNQTTLSLAGRLSDAEGNLTTLTATVNGLQTTVSDVQGNVANLTVISNAMQARLSDAEGNINTLTLTSQSMQSTISSLQDEWDNLEIGGRNLILNSEDTTIINNTFLGWDIVYEELHSHLGKEVTFSFEARSLTRESDLMRVYFRGNGTHYFDTQEITNEWSRYSITFKIVSQMLDKPQIAFHLSSAPATGFTGEFRKLQLEKGNRATDWTPAPEDMATQSQITQLSDAINLRVTKGDVINQINLDTSGVLISGKHLILDGNTTVRGTFKLDGSAHIKDASIGTAQIGTIDAAIANIINLSANSIVGGILQSQNSNTYMNLNTGEWYKENSDITLGGGASIKFTDRYNSLTYKPSTITAGLGFDIGASGNVITFLGSAFPTLNTNDFSWSGLIVSSQASQTDDDTWSSFTSRHFMIRDRTNYNKAIRFDLKSTRPNIRPVNTGTYNYDLGAGNNWFDRIYTAGFRGVGETDIRHKDNANHGYRFELLYPSGTGMAFRGLNTHIVNYNLGQSGARFNNVFLTQNPNVSSDERLKTDINDLGLGLDFINRIEAKQFRLKLTTADINQGKSQNPIQYGIIAQQVNSVLADFGVSDSSLITKSEDGYYGAQYEQFIPTLIKSVQELDTKFTDDVNYLKLKVQYLEQKIKQLEGVA